ncbi:hypothetical protein HanIR_Chr17g0877801 [Helianthus annuus]|nr:hypothetical protein HanIR_Chr17g0877801 [Helianthus annuus]
MQVSYNFNYYGFRRLDRLVVYVSMWLENKVFKDEDSKPMVKDGFSAASKDEDGGIRGIWEPTGLPFSIALKKLTDLARYARIFKLRLSKEVIQGLEGVTSSWTGYIPLNLVLF